MFHPVVGNDELRLRGEALEDGGLDGRFNKIPSSSRFSPDRFVPVRVQDLQTLWTRFRARITVERLSS